MADPTKYDVDYSFSSWQASNPSRPLPADRVDVELANIETSIGEIVDAVKNVRRSDGALKNGIVTSEALAADVRSLLGDDSGLMQTTSTTSTSVGTGAKTFTVESGLLFIAGQPVVVASAAAPTTNYMSGLITSYSGTTLVVAVTLFGGSGTYSDWLVSLAGVPGATGATGPAGSGSGDMLKSENLSGLSNYGTARANLGLGSLAVLNAPANNSVTTAMLVDGSVTTAKQADGSTTTAKIADGNVTTAKLADDAVTFAKIQNATANSRLVGSGASGSGADYSEITLGAGLSMGGTTLTATSINLATPIASTSGTSIDFTDIPSTTKRITINFVGVSTNGTDNWLIQLGDSGGVETTGYSSGSYNVNGGATGTSSSGFLLLVPAAAAVAQGTITLCLENASTFTWCASGTLATSDTFRLIFTSGSKSLSAALDRIRVTTTGGTNTFDGGEINISCEGV